MKIFGIATKYLFVIAIPLFLIAASIAIAVNSLWWYESGFAKNNISQVTGISEPELKQVATGLIRYFNSSEEYISLTVVKDSKPFKLFNQTEIMHLKDVKGLFWLDYKVLLGALLYLLAYAAVLLWRKNKTELARGLIGGAGLTLVLMLALGVGIRLGFDQLFWQFHLLSFANDFWLLDPTKDYLIMLVPQPFWFDTFSFVAVLTAGLAVVMGGVGGWYLWIKRSAP